MTKKQLRDSILKQRDLLSPAAVEELSARVWMQVADLPVFEAARSLLFYASFRGEVDTFAMMRACLAQGKQVALPKADPSTRRLSFHRVSDLSQLESGPYGILEPPALPSTALETASLDLVIVPAAVFDLRGHRIGYGGGYYDRFLVGTPLTRVGLAYDFQIVDKIPEEEHDLAVNYIVTENRVITLP